MSDTPTTAQDELCSYPGCTRGRALGGDGPGAKPKYCDDPAHTALTAFRRRREIARQDTGEPDPDDLGRPVSLATARAAQLRAGIHSDVQALANKLVRALGELRTIADPEAVEAQLETIQAEAQQQVAQAGARAAAEARRRQQAEERAEEARAAADALDERLWVAEQARQAAEAERDAAQQRTGEVEEEAARRVEAAERRAAQRVAAAHGERDDALSRTQAADRRADRAGSRRHGRRTHPCPG